MDESREHDRILIREIRRGVTAIHDGLFAWARAEPDEGRKELARLIAKALVQVTRAMAALNGDGKVVPGDSRTLPPPRNRPPHHFTD